LVEQLSHPLDVVRGELASVRLAGEAKWIGASETRVGVADVAVAAEELDDGIASLDDAIGEPTGIVAPGAFRDRCERCRFRKVEVFDRFAEVALGRALDAIGAVAEVDLIQVELE